MSFRIPTKVQCLRCQASVHSTNATWQTNFGLIQRHCSIFSAVNDSPHREALFSGRFLKGHWAVCSALRDGEIIPDPRHKAVLHLRDKLELLVLINAYERCIEPACSRNVTADDELLLQVRAELDPGTRSGTRFVEGIDPFAHDALEAKLAHGLKNFARRRLQ